MNSIPLTDSIAFIRDRTTASPKIGIILGSGLGTFADHLDIRTVIDCREIPHYPASTVEGHAGLMIFGQLDGIDVLALKGRVHSYEGYSLQQVTYPVRIMAELGIQSLIVTNAAGGVNTNFSAGDLMIIANHINFSFSNPLIGASVSDEEQRFVNLAQAYYPPYIEAAERVARELNIPIQKGTLFMIRGPSYETAAEVRMIRILGGDAVTMSTVPEVIVAKQVGMNVLGISCITNMSTGISASKLDHTEVTVMAKKIEHTFVKLISAIIKHIAAL